MAEYLKSGNASAAYRAAYDAGKMKPETVNNNAYALLKNSEIAARLAQHQQALQKRTEVTLENLTAELEADRASARIAGQFAVAVSASKAIADMHGLQVEARKNERRPYEDLSDEQLAERIESRLAEAGYTIQ